MMSECSSPSKRNVLIQEEEEEYERQPHIPYIHLIAQTTHKCNMHLHPRVVGAWYFILPYLSVTTGCW